MLPSSARRLGVWCEAMSGAVRVAVMVVVVLGIGVAAAPDGSRGPPPGGAAAQVTAPPPPGAPLPDRAPALAAALTSTARALDRAIDRWTSAGNPSRGGPPRDVTLLALHHQRIHRRLRDHPALRHAVLRRLSPAQRAESRDIALAGAELRRITSVHHGPPPEIRTGPAEPAGVLWRWYREARRRFHVGAPLLAAVNFVESAFGRLRNRSVSGAQGPMQFMPATWRAYGLGGDVHDPHDAILGAANYLHASGAPADERAALHHYNPSPLYVSAVSRYARRIRADRRAFYALYAWQVYVGDERVTGPGIR